MLLFKQFLGDALVTIDEGAPLTIKLDTIILDASTIYDDLLILIGMGKRKVVRVEGTKIVPLGETDAKYLPKHEGSRTFKIIGNVAIYPFSDGSKLKVVATGEVKNPNRHTLVDPVGFIWSITKKVYFNDTEIKMPLLNSVVRLCNDYMAVSLLDEMVLHEVKNGKMSRVGSYKARTKSWSFSRDCEFIALSDIAKIYIFRTKDFRKVIEIKLSGKVIHKVAWGRTGLWVVTRDVITDNYFILLYDYLASPTKREPPPGL